MRLIVWTSALLALSIGGAGASSFVSVAPPKSSPSIITLGGAPRPPENAALLAFPPPDLLAVSEREAASVIRPVSAKLVSISPSVIAFQGLEPSVTSEKVAAVKQPTRPFVPSTPMVIRGGIVGDPFGTVKPPAAEAARTPAGPNGKPGPVQASAPGQKGAGDGAEQQSGTGQPAADQPSPDQARPTPAPPSRGVRPE